MLLSVVWSEDLVDQASAPLGPVQDRASILEGPHQAKPTEGLARGDVDQVLVGRLLVQQRCV